MVTIRERLATLEVKVKILLMLVVTQLGIDVAPFASAILP